MKRYFCMLITIALMFPLVGCTHLGRYQENRAESGLGSEDNIYCSINGYRNRY